jgi:hypothetical protein
MFSLRNDGKDEAGMSFTTIDPSISGDFGNVFESEWDRAERAIYRGRW